MANELRVRQNFLGGLIEDNPLTSSATTLTSAALAAMVTIGTTQHMPITLDPDGLYGEPEIAWITAHTAAATTATIWRGVEGSVARQHLRDVPWAHGPTAQDILMPTAPAFVRAASAGITGTALILTPTSAPSAGRCLLAVLNISQFGGAKTVSPPSDWIQVLDTVSTSNSNDRLYVFWKRAVASEPTTYTFTVSGSEAHGGILIEIDSGQPIAVADNRIAAPYTLSPAIFDPQGNRLALGIWYADNANNGSSTISSGWTKASEVNGGSGGTAHGLITAYMTTPTQAGSGSNATVTTTQTSTGCAALLIG